MCGCLVGMGRGGGPRVLWQWLLLTSALHLWYLRDVLWEKQLATPALVLCIPLLLSNPCEWPSLVESSIGLWSSVCWLCPDMRMQLLLHFISFLRAGVEGWSRSELEFLSGICLQVNEKRSVLIALFACMWVQRCPCSCFGHDGVHCHYVKCEKKKIRNLSMTKSQHRCTQMWRAVIFFNISLFLS